LEGTCHVLFAKTMSESWAGLQLVHDTDVVWPPAVLAVRGELKLVESRKKVTVSRLLLPKNSAPEM
jgi:hypothetical protein